MCKYKHLLMTAEADNMNENVYRRQKCWNGRKKAYVICLPHMRYMRCIVLFHLPSWFYVLPENVAFRAMETETSVWESCCLRFPTENAFRSTPKEPPSEVYSCSWAQFLWDMIFNCSLPLKVAERGREVWEDRKILLFFFWQQ